jgi:hypothetical protein
MPAKPQDQLGGSAPSKPGKESTKQMEVTAELVHAITDRIYAMLLRDLRIERERERLCVRDGRR